jgi:hypothetical protein
MIDAAAGDGKWRATKLLSVRRYSAKYERTKMVAVDFDLEGIHCSRIGQRHLE